jgi:hypothetical protein
MLSELRDRNALPTMTKLGEIKELISLRRASARRGGKQSQQKNSGKTTLQTLI